LTKPLGLGVLNNRHKAHRRAFPEAVATMTTLEPRCRAGCRRGRCGAATDVTGFGLLGHLYKMARGQRGHRRRRRRGRALCRRRPRGLARRLRQRRHPRNLAWVRDRPTCGAVGEEEALLLADAQTSGGLLVAGEVPGYPVVGELVDTDPYGRTIVVR
jgi:selenide,water dikinase